MDCLTSTKKQKTPRGYTSAKKLTANQQIQGFKKEGNLHNITTLQPFPTILKIILNKSQPPSFQNLYLHTKKHIAVLRIP